MILFRFKSIIIQIMILFRFKSILIQVLILLRFKDKSLRRIGTPEALLIVKTGHECDEESLSGLFLSSLQSLRRPFARIPSHHRPACAPSLMPMSYSRDAASPRSGCTPARQVSLRELHMAVRKEPARPTHGTRCGHRIPLRRSSCSCS